jgi:hypothetical protein
MRDDILQTFLYWMQERHAIYNRRKAGQPPPWTDDPLLANFRWCNVFRELDRETVLLRKHWREPYANHENLWFAMCMARQVNWWPSLEEIGFPETWDARHTYEVLAGRIRKGYKAYTGVYMLPGCYGINKPWGTAYNILDEIYKNRALYMPKPGDTLQSAWYRLHRAPGFGFFLAYEVVTDWRHTRYLRDATDIMTWANAGPGAIRGLNRLFGLDLKARRKREKYNEEMVELLEVAKRALPPDFPKLELRDIEHSLCEMDKYLRLKAGGQVRNKYDARNAKTLVG